MIHMRAAKVLKVVHQRAGMRELLVKIDGQVERAISYDQLVGPLDAEEEVIVNTTAADLKLGTGGYHFVLSKSKLSAPLRASSGHIMKLRYTPCQLKVMSVEEQSSPHRKKIKDFRSLADRPVIAIPLHSMLAPVVALLKYVLGPSVKLAYVMTEGGALPLSFSKSVHELRERKLLDGVITAGHAFGGDYEAVNVYTGLIAASEVVAADVVVAGIGPGKVGTETTYGFSEIEQGEIMNAASILGARTIGVPRINFADRNYRHYGVSPHTLTVLSEVALRRCLVPLPMLTRVKMNVLRRQLRGAGIFRKHDVKEIAADLTFEALKRFKVDVETMGRTLLEEPDFFLAAGAGALLAATRISVPARAKSLSILETSGIQ